MWDAAYEDPRLYTLLKTDDPEALALRRKFIERLLESMPEVREEVQHHARLEQWRAMLRRVLKARRLALSAQDEAQIDACADHDTLRRWLEQAAVAPTVAEALR